MSHDINELIRTRPIAELDFMFPHIGPKELRRRRKELKREYHNQQERKRHRTLTQGYGREAAGLFYEPRIIPPTDPVQRDPCPRCGVRGDVECGHSRTRLGMVL